MADPTTIDMTLRPEHERALDEMRAEMVAELRYWFSVRIGYDASESEIDDPRAFTRHILHRVRALDALREGARDYCPSCGEVVTHADRRCFDCVRALDEGLG